MIKYSFNNIGSALAKPYQSPENAYRCYRMANRALNLPGSREFERAFRSHLLAQQPTMALHLRNDYTIRNCVQCSRRYFHTSLYNIPWLIRCPIHTNERLLDKCPECGMRWVFHWGSRQHQECTLCGISGRVTLPKQSETDLIEQALAPIVACVSIAYPEWFQRDTQCALKVVDINAQSSMQMLFFGGAYMDFENKFLRPCCGQVFRQLPFHLQPTVLSECLPEYAKSIQLSSKVFPYSKRTSSLISRGNWTSDQIWAMHVDGFVKQDSRPCWLDDSINTIVGNSKDFLKSESLCRCDVANNTCTLCKGFLVWKEKIRRTLSVEHFQRQQVPILDDCSSASGAYTYVKNYLPPLMVMLRLSEFEFRCYEIPDDFRKIAFSIKLYSSFCDEVLRSSNLATSVDGNVTAIAGLIDNELLNEYLQQHTFKSFSPDKNAEFFDLFRASNSLFYFFDDHAQFHMLYPKLIDAIMDKARH